ncbi:hypothetical protein PIB30_061281 [Stylosanthes scabra]|uniref:Uncharacterized protein n=1 Tax=Stylosanthes scabra TaxID=79078 RepID=A0ABU6ULP3_9FABA|nr:hypothetical protein [Stylosanthes scabra]
MGNGYQMTHLDPNPIKLVQDRWVIGSSIGSKGVEPEPSRIPDDSSLLVGHLLAALFLKNWALRLVRNIAPTRELEAFGPSLRVPTSYLPSATCLFETQVLRGDASFFFADVSEGNDDFSLAFCGECGFQNFCNRSINYLPPEFSKALSRLRRSFIFKVFLTAVILRNDEEEILANVRVPRVLSVAERELYDWVDEEIFTLPSVVEADALLELRREMRLTVDRAAKGDYVLEAAGPSDRLPFRAQEDRVHFLWLYSELFTRLGIRLPFSDFQREVLSRCRVAAGQLHLNGWGFLRTFERVWLHFGFRPSWRVFLYTYQLHAPPPGRGFMSFRAYQGRKLFDSFEESIQEFK